MRNSATYSSPKVWQGEGLALNSFTAGDEYACQTLASKMTQVNFRTDKIHHLHQGENYQLKLSKKVHFLKS